MAVGRYAAAAGAISNPPAAAPPQPPTYYDGTYTVLDAVPGDEPPDRGRRLWPWLVALLVLLLIGGGIAAYLLTRPAKVAVPALVGEQIATAQTELQNDGLTVSPLQLTSSTPAGTVIRQDPLAGTKVKEGTNVSLTVSSGPGNTTVPTVLGETLAQARAAILIATPKAGSCSASVEQPVLRRPGDQHHSSGGRDPARRHEGDVLRLERAGRRLRCPT